MASSRVGVTAMGMGQAAGVAAALCVKTGASPRTVDVGALRAELVKQAAVLDG